MTTNQTIDGVPRELLSDWLKALNSRTSVPVAIRKMRNEMRALLDAPDECRCKRFGKGNPHWPCPVHAELAAQPQGEPVAWIKPDVAKTLTKDECCYAFGSQNPKGTLIPLYAEQPAPVAVVMTGRRPIPAGIESLAQQIYQSWESQPGFVPWVDGGNSTKQEEARQIASRTFELALANQVGD